MSRTLKYPEFASELVDLLEKDQTEWKTFWAEYYDRQATLGFKDALKQVKAHQKVRSQRMMIILQIIKEPTITNIGSDAAQAISILALHDHITVLSEVHAAFVESNAKNHQDTYYQAIPSTTDRLCILNRQPQIFGTQWDFNEHNYPFLPTVKDFKSVNQRRAEYDIEPLRWPRSLAMPEAEQPWLKRSLSELIMRDVTDEEFEAKYKDCI